MESKAVSSRIKLIDMGLGQIITKNKKLIKPRGSIYYLAPEMIKKNYDQKVDIWSSGVIFFILVTGKPPFSAMKRGPNGSMALDNEAIKRKILKGYIDFEDKAFKYVDKGVIEILKMMFIYDSEKRASASDILKHPWFDSKEENEDRQLGNIFLGQFEIIVLLIYLIGFCLNLKVLDEVLENLKNFNKSSYLKKGVSMYLANYFDLKEEKEKFYSYFKKMDQDQDGQLSFIELQHAYSFKVNKLIKHFNTHS